MESVVVTDTRLMVRQVRPSKLRDGSGPKSGGGEEENTSLPGRAVTTRGPMAPRLLARMCVCVCVFSYVPVKMEASLLFFQGIKKSGAPACVR